MKLSRRILVASMAFLAMPLAPVAASGTTPLSMVRSLQFVQDAVIKGDHSAIEMQHHLLRLIDERLRAADRNAFEDKATVDAAIIYSLSGGNPATLPFLADRHAGAHIAPELMDLLEVHLAGRGQRVFEQFRAILPQYRDSRIEPYLTLVTANAAASASPGDAMALFDRARLLAPGSIIEEAALRRSLGVALELGEIDNGLVRAERYVRRFLHSPYAGQFADLFVELVVQHPADIGSERIAETIASMDDDRQRSIYLRIARQAAIAGRGKLATDAAAAAEALGNPDGKVSALSGLYAGMVAVPGEDTLNAARAVGAIDEAALSPRDRALRAAAASVAASVLAEPADAIGQSVDLPDFSLTEPSPEADLMPEDIDDLSRFVAGHREELDAIDTLLEGAR